MSCPPDKGNLDPLGLREVEVDVPQLFADDHLIESRFDRNQSAATVPHVLHRPKRPSEPVLIPTKPWEESQGVSHPAIIYDPRQSLFRMYYTVVQPVVRGEPSRPGYPPGKYFLCYAQSEDGIHWDKPDLGLLPWGEIGETNILLQGDSEAKIAHVHMDCGSEEGLGIRNIGMLPEGSLRGHRFVMFYGDGPQYLATSRDGIHWQPKVHKIIANRIDCYETIVYDDVRREFVIFLRNTLIFGDSKNQGDEVGGNTRMICRLSSEDLWSEWDTMPVSVLIPDTGDAMRFYAMPTFVYGGIYWGMLQHLEENPQSMEIELVYSRNGIDWHHLPDRERLITLGEPGSWDSGMVMSADRLIENGDEWWLYYCGYDGYHGSRTRISSIGLLKFRKEGLISVRAADEDSYVLTRPMHWPGGELFINADAENGCVQIRVTDLRRNTIEGYGYDSSVPFRGSEIRHPVVWKTAKMTGLKGELIRLEFKFRKADLFGFIVRERP